MKSKVIFRAKFMHRTELTGIEEKRAHLTLETTTKPAECGAAAGVIRLPVERLPNYHISH